MAITAEAAPLIRQLFGDLEPSGKLMIFGRPTMLWPDAPTPEAFYKSLGFDEVHTMDVSPYQGATHIHDLNSPETPTDLIGQYRFVLSGGTLEHVFCIWNAVKTAIRLLEPGGWFRCSAPCNNRVDHGFYQISPTWKFDYFHANGFEFGRSIANIVDPQTKIRTRLPCYPGEAGILNSMRGTVGHVLEVRKLPTSTVDAVPTQGIYVARHGGERRKFVFRSSEPQVSKDGHMAPLPQERFSIDSAAIIRKDGHFAAPFRSANHASLTQRPFRSKALIYEDGSLLPWIVSSPDLVDVRNGAFCHFPGFVHFSSIDGSDPRGKGRRYEIAFPYLSLNSSDLS